MPRRREISQREVPAESRIDRRLNCHGFAAALEDCAVLVVPVGLLVPIGAVFLALLVGYGLLEYVGVLVQPVMRPVWRTPGRSARSSIITAGVNTLR